MYLICFIIIIVIIITIILFYCLNQKKEYASCSHYRDAHDCEKFPISVTCQWKNKECSLRFTPHGPQDDVSNIAIHQIDNLISPYGTPPKQNSDPNFQ